MDMEELIKDIERQMSEPKNEYIVLWFSEAEYVLSLLKEQEAVEPYHVNTNHEQHWKCGKCNAVISLQDKFCHECGQAVKWE